MKCEILKRTAIALFVGGIVSATATAEGTSVETAGSSFGKAINAEITKQTDAIKSEVTEKITKQDEKITKQDEKIEEINGDLSGVASDLVGVAANSYNNTLTLNGFKAGDTVYDVNPDTNKVTPKKATEEDVKNDPLEGKGIVATVVKNKDSIEDLSEDLAATDDKVKELAGHVEKNKEKLNEAADAVKDLQDGVSDLNEVLHGPEGKPEEGLVGVVDKHTEAIYGDGTDANPGLMKVVSKQTEAINELKAYNHLDDVKALVANKADKTDVDDLRKGAAAAAGLLAQGIGLNKTNIEKKADKQALEDLKKEVSTNSEAITSVSDQVEENHNSIENVREEHYNLVSDVKKFVEDYNKFADDTNKELDDKANASEVYTKTESDSKLEAKADKTALEAKADKTELVAKADKTELANKADKNNVYSKSDADQRFALKADNSVVNNQTVEINKLRTDVNAHTVDINKLRTDVNAHTKRLDHLDNRVNKLDKDLKRGLAAQAALTGLFQPYTVGKANFTAAVGGYKSQTAVAIGTGYRYNQNIATKAGVAFTQGGGVTYNAGVNFEW